MIRSEKFKGTTSERWMDYERFLDLGYEITHHVIGESATLLRCGNVDNGLMCPLPHYHPGPCLNGHPDPPIAVTTWTRSRPVDQVLAEVTGSVALEADDDDGRDRGDHGEHDLDSDVGWPDGRDG